MKKYKFILLLLAFIIIVLQIFLLCNNDYKSSAYQKYIPKFEDNINDILNNYEIINQYYDYIPAKIINRSGLIKNLFLLNKGQKDGINEGSFVVNDLGLIGEVVKTFNHFSVIRLIFSNETKLAIESNGCYGTLHAENGKLIINDIINCDDINKNDAVFTSKYNYSSSNILIGYVKSISNNKILIEPAINKYKINYVGVINDID